jgi:hypothetical protein
MHDSSSTLLTAELQDTNAFTPASNEKALQEQLRILVCYLWDNYLQMYDPEDLFIMGVGNAYLGVKVLLLNRSKYPLSSTMGVY